MKLFTIFGVSIVLCFIKMLYGNRNFFLGILTYPTLQLRNHVKSLSLVKNCPIVFKPFKP
jgi:hypothetical protein